MSISNPCLIAILQTWQFETSPSFIESRLLQLLRTGCCVLCSNQELKTDPLPRRALWELDSKSMISNRALSWERLCFHISMTSLKRCSNALAQSSIAVFICLLMKVGVLHQKLFLLIFSHNIIKHSFVRFSDFLSPRSRHCSLTWSSKFLVANLILHSQHYVSGLLPMQDIIRDLFCKHVNRRHRMPGGEGRENCWHPPFAAP